MNEQNRSTPSHPDAREALGQPGGVDGGQQSQLEQTPEQKLADQLPSEMRPGSGVPSQWESGEKDSIRDQRENRRNITGEKIGDGE